MKLRTMIVEDEKYQAEAVKHLLQQISSAQMKEAGIDGIEVAVADCAAEARRLLQQAALDSKPYDILLLDLGLPETPGNSESGDRGLEILETCVIVMLEELTADLATRATRMGAREILGKPLDADHVKDCLRLLPFAVTTRQPLVEELTKKIRGRSSSLMNAIRQLASAITSPNCCPMTG
jgi:DNA-binding NtrC family response regulator